MSLEAEGSAPAGNPVGVPAPSLLSEPPAPQPGVMSSGTGANSPAAGANSPEVKAPPTGTWRDKLPEELRAHKSLSKFETEEGLAKSYVNLERMLGHDKVPVPKTPDDKEAWEAYYKAGGRPDAPDAYEVKRPDDMPAGMTYDEEGEKFLRQFAHANGFNQTQFAAAYDTYFKREAERLQGWQQSQTQAKEEGVRSLQREHGSGFDKFLNGARVALRQYGDDAAISKLEAAGLANDPDIIRVFGKVGKELVGEQHLKGNGTSPSGPADIQQRISEHREKYKAVLFDKHHPEHETRVREMKQMFEALHGTGPA
jgi:hypothetical protein